MQTVLINVDKKSDLVFLLSLTKKLGISVKVLSHAQVKDWNLTQKIKAGMKSRVISRSEVIKL